MIVKSLIARKMHVPATEAWDAIKSIGRLEAWFPSIVSCRLEGSGIGARRYITFDRNRGEAEDHVVRIDDQAWVVVYRRVRSPFPVLSYTGTVEVFRSADALAVVAWTVDFEPADGDGAALKTDLEVAIGAALQGMEADLKTSGPDR